MVTDRRERSQCEPNGLRHWVMGFMKQTSFIWVMTFWMVMSAILRPGWLIFSSGFIFCIALMYLKTPGVFWHFIGIMTLDRTKLERYLEKSVSYKPVIPQPYLRLGMIHYQRREWPRAIPLLRQAITLMGGKCPPQLKIILATAYREDGQEHIAVPLLQEMIDQGFKTAEAYYNLAVCLFRVRDDQVALGAAEAAHALDPTAVRPRMILGLIHFRMRDFVAAKHDYQWLVGALPKPAESLYWLGRTEFELGEVQPAAEHLRLAADRIGEHRGASDIPIEEVRHWLKAASDAPPDSPASSKLVG
jgi:tetratricopeptide (TPR) repeat protein